MPEDEVELVDSPVRVGVDDLVVELEAVDVGVIAAVVVTVTVWVRDEEEVDEGLIDSEQVPVALKEEALVALGDEEQEGLEELELVLVLAGELELVMVDVGERVLGPLGVGVVDTDGVALLEADVVGVGVARLRS
eukprot:gb/GECG01002533.1/.p1 GENE.gb/GECG01002533.1/~~gb/GECG01002533.1/.p1  ORF type:complete len:135 (+),score=31.17 gb/GECG01002533.1/:1-405(+)